LLDVHLAVYAPATERLRARQRRAACGVSARSVRGLALHPKGKSAARVRARTFCRMGCSMRSASTLALSMEEGAQPSGALTLNMPKPGCCASTEAM
jgi:hypothetical protein